MNKRCMLAVVFCVAVDAQDRDDVVKKDTVSVHTVERGSMPILAAASGTLTSVQGRRAVLLIERDSWKCEAGRAARLVVGEDGRPRAGKVVGRNATEGCEVEFNDALPVGAKAGDKVGGLVTTEELKDVVFFGRPAQSRANSTATIFVLDGDSRARRVTVRYGAMSGPLIQVMDGIAPGDKVIVTDMSKWADLPRVRLE